MTAPKRWLDDAGGATPLEKDVLRAGLELDPPAGAAQATWAAIAGKLPGPGGTGGPTTSGPAGGPGAPGAAGASGASAAGGGILKSLLLGAGAGVVALGTYTALAPVEPESHGVAATTAAPAAVVRPSESADPIGAAMPTAIPSAEEGPPEEPSNAPRVQAKARAAEPPAPGGGTPEEAPEAVAARESARQLREETEMLARAHDRLRNGDAQGSLTLLDEIRARFPNGKLAQEREALTVKALHKVGQRDAARERAKEFVRTYPTSALARPVEAFAK